MKPLRQSTTVTVRLGPYVSTTDGSAKTGLNVTTLKTNTKISKNFAACAAVESLVAMSEDANGYYFLTLDGTEDMDALKSLRVQSTDSANYLPMWEDFWVYPAVVYDALFAGTDTLPVDLTQILGTTITETTPGNIPAAWQQMWDVDAPTATAEGLSGNTTWITTINSIWATVQTLVASIVAALSGHRLTVISATEETEDGVYITIHQGKAGSVTLESPDARTLTSETVTVDVAGQTLDTTVTGSAGDWTIVIPFSATESALMKSGEHDYEINLLSGGVPQDPPIAYLSKGWIVVRDV
jgi:hypothetical protein